MERGDPTSKGGMHKWKVSRNVHTLQEEEEVEEKEEEEERESPATTKPNQQGCDVAP